MTLRRLLETQLLAFPKQVQVAPRPGLCPKLPRLLTGFGKAHPGEAAQPQLATSAMNEGAQDP
ncbi:MAG: hypothetical protein AAFV31_08575 [Pseudomonadota bacterium]